MATMVALIHSHHSRVTETLALSNHNQTVETMEAWIAMATMVALIHCHHSRVTEALALSNHNQTAETMEAWLAMTTIVTQIHSRQSKTMEARTLKDLRRTVLKIMAMVEMVAQVRQDPSKTQVNNNPVVISRLVVALILKVHRKIQVHSNQLINNKVMVVRCHRYNSNPQEANLSKASNLLAPLSHLVSNKIQARLCHRESCKAKIHRNHRLSSSLLEMPNHKISSSLWPRISPQVSNKFQDHRSHLLVKISPKAPHNQSISNSHLGTLSHQASSKALVHHRRQDSHKIQAHLNPKDNRINLLAHLSPKARNNLQDLRSLLASNKPQDLNS